MMPDLCEQPTVDVEPAFMPEPVFEPEFSEYALKANRERVAGLRAMADFLEAHPQHGIGSAPDMYVFPNSDEAMRKAIVGCGLVMKKVDNNYFYLVKDFGGGVEIRWARDRDKICHRVKIGEKVVAAEPEKVIPAQPEQVVPAKPEHVEEVFEWKCPDSILQSS